MPATQRATAEATSGRTKLRFTYGRWLLFLATAQIVIADAGFFWYAIANSWQISDRAIIGWLGATALEVVAAVIAVARGLFTSDDAARSSS